MVEALKNKLTNKLRSEKKCTNLKVYHKINMEFSDKD